jgi:hypothetical protein
MWPAQWCIFSGKHIVGPQAERMVGWIVRAVWKVTVSVIIWTQMCILLMHRSYEAQVVPSTASPSSHPFYRHTPGTGFHGYRMSPILTFGTKPLLLILAFSFGNMNLCACLADLEVRYVRCKCMRDETTQTQWECLVREWWQWWRWWRVLED